MTPPIIPQAVTPWEQLNKAINIQIHNMDEPINFNALMQLMTNGAPIDKSLEISLLYPHISYNNDIIERAETISRFLIERAPTFDANRVTYQALAFGTAPLAELVLQKAQEKQLPLNLNDTYYYQYTNDHTPIFFALERNWTSKVELMHFVIEHDADLTITDSQGKTFATRIKEAIDFPDHSANEIIQFTEVLGIVNHHLGLDQEE